MIYNHIMVAYDGSEASERALDHALRFVDVGLSARLSVVHVLPRTPYGVGDLAVNPPDSYFKWLDEHTFGLIALVKEKIRGVPYGKVVSLEGHPAGEILSYASDSNCDLIVMGSRGLGFIKEMMLGSVSHHVVSHARIPVLIVK